MRKLLENLKFFMKKTLHKYDFIDSATVPVIKLKIDLFKVHS